MQVQASDSLFSRHQGSLTGLSSNTLFCTKPLLLQRGTSSFCPFYFIMFFAQQHFHAFLKLHKIQRVEKRMLGWGGQLPRHSLVPVVSVAKRKGLTMWVWS